MECLEDEARETVIRQKTKPVYGGGMAIPEDGGMQVRS